MAFRSSMRIMRRQVFFLLECVALMLPACTTGPKTIDVRQIGEKVLPARLAVMPAQFLAANETQAGDFPVQAESEKGRFIADLSRGVVHNQLVGKGYQMSMLSLVDKKLSPSDWKKTSAQELCQQLEVDGIVYTDIITATMITGVAYDLFKIEAEIRLIDKTGTELSKWGQSASKRKVSLPTSPVGLAAVVAGAFLEDPARQQMRMVIYDWGWKLSQAVPDNLHGKILPEVISVNSNIDKGVFAAGEQILVEAVAEKGLNCTFELGDFKKDLPMDGSDRCYKGRYVVQEGDRIAGQQLSVRFMRPNGIQRVWVETVTTVTIDGAAPTAPQKLDAQVNRDGISLSWNLPHEEDLNVFAVERSMEPAGDYAPIVHTKEVHCLDKDVIQGKTYFYRVRAIDRAGNRSAFEKSVQATVPYYEEVALSGNLTGTLVSGVYRVKGEACVPHGDVLSVGAGCTVILEPQARIVVEGTLKVIGVSQSPVQFAGDGWTGIHAGPRGKIEMTGAGLKGCSPCIESAGGSLTLRSVFIRGNSGDGIVVKENGPLDLMEVQVSHCRRGIAIECGHGAIQACTVHGNDVGIDLSEGDVAVKDSNVYKNSQIDVRAQRKIVLKDNFLGTLAVKELRLDGDILVKSLLDAPFPHGRKVVLVTDKEITPEEMESQFQGYKSRGVSAFIEKKYGDAYQELEKALELKEDKEVFFYLAYTLSSLGEEKKMIKTLNQGIEAFPYEVRLYKIYIKHLAEQGKKNEALSVLGKAEKMNPQDQELSYLKQVVEAAGDQGP